MIFSCCLVFANLNKGVEDAMPGLDRQLKIDEIKRKRSKENKLCNRETNFVKERRIGTHLSELSETRTMQRLKKLNQEVLELLRR